MTERSHCQCYKSAKNKSERCPNHALPNSRFCGVHKNCHRLFEPTLIPVETPVLSSVSQHVSSPSLPPREVSLDDISDSKIFMLCQNMMERKEYQLVAQLVKTNRHIYEICHPLLTRLKKQIRPCLTGQQLKSDYQFVSLFLGSFQHPMKNFPIGLTQHPPKK